MIIDALRGGPNVVAVAVLALALLVIPASAEAMIVERDGLERVQPYQRWADRSHVKAPDGRVRLVTQDRAVHRNCTYAGLCARFDNWTIYMYFEVDRAARYDFMHEVGHLFDRMWMTGRKRRAFARLIHQRGRWFTSDGGIGELFADAYALCSVRRGWTGRVPYYGYGYEPSQRLHRRVCRFIRTVR